VVLADPVLDLYANSRRQFARQIGLTLRGCDFFGFWRVSALLTLLFSARIFAKIQKSHNLSA